MAMELESLVVSLALDSVDLQNNLKTAQGSLDGFAKNAKQIGGVMSAAVTAPLAAIGIASINMASDLAETTSKVDTLFGEQSASIQAWSQDSAAAFGLSQQAALDSVGTLGNMFMQLGSNAADAAELSQGMVGLSADIASFHNVAGGSEEVLGAMTSAFRGEYDALQRYIPTINAAAVEHAALAMTGKETASELTNLEKAMAVQQMIMEGAGAAVGDFARTSDGLANSQRILQADLANISAELGQELLPIAVAVANGLKDLIGWFKELSPEVKHNIVIVAGIAAAAGPVILAIGTLAGAISGIIGFVGTLSAALPLLGAALAVLTGPIGLIVLAVAGLAAAWATDFLGIKTKTKEFWTWISTETPRQLDELKTSWNTFTTWLTADNETKLEVVQLGFEGLYTWLDTQTDGTLTTVKGYWDNYINGITTVTAGGIQIVAGDWEGGLDTIKTVTDSIWASIYSVFGTQIDAVKRVITEVDWMSLGTAIMQGIADGINEGLHWITDAASNAAQTALDAAKALLGISSPSKVAAKDIGLPFAQGVGVGMQRGLDDLVGRIDTGLASMMGSLSEPTPVATAGGNSYVINVALSGSATEADGRAVGIGILEEFRARGLA